MNSKTLYPLLLLLFALAACQPSGERKEGTDNASLPPAEQAQDSTAAPAVPLNPNLATADELGAVLPDSLVSQIMDLRPFLSTADFYNLLNASLTGEEVEAASTKVFLPINLNTATREEILAVPGVGNKMAHEFEEYRPYSNMDQFRREIGKYVSADIVKGYEAYVFIPINLNTATRQEILAIPGVGNKMAHEFEEYRPYQNIEQFRREIGKYVDQQEVARLERYVTL